ncbi:MAG: helix-turn-helix transcriptional regulator, partial [Dermatophilaceae bacterium]
GAVGLRVLRESRGLTQQELAEAVAQLAWSENQRAVGLNADMISKWERGLKLPSRMYVRLLSAFFGLGIPEFRMVLGPPEPSTSTGAAGVPSPLSHLDPTHGHDIARMVAEDAVRRRSMLRLMGLAPLSAVLSPTTPAGEPAARTSASSLDALAQEYQRLYRLTDPEALLVAVTGHLRCISAQLADARDNPFRARLLANLGEVALLAGRLAFFDLGDAHAARGHLTAALEAARETGDGLLAAVVLGHLGFVAAASLSFNVAADYLAGAAASATGTQAPPILSWVAAVEAEINTRAGERDRAWRALDRATDLLGKPCDPAPLWFDFYDASRIEGFKGDSYQAFGRAEEARLCLQRSLDSLPAESTKQRSVVLTDLATVHLRDKEVDQAYRTAGMAVDALRSAGYATGKGRLLSFRKRLAGLGAEREVRALDEQLSLL